MATGIRKPAHSSAASPAVSGGATFNRRGGIYCRPPYDVGGDKPLPYDNSGNIDATHSNTAPSWTNHPHALRPVASQQVETNSATQFINVADEISSSRRTYNPSNSAAGDTEAIAAKGRLVLINGAVPTIQAQTGAYPSELFFHRNPTYNENTIAVSSDRGALEISGANLMYEGARVKTWIVGRDLNPGGRGDGAHYAQGMFSAGMVRPRPTSAMTPGEGNSINNGCGLPWDRNHEGTGNCEYFSNEVTCDIPGKIPWPIYASDYGYGEFYSSCNLLTYHYLPTPSNNTRWRVSCIYDPSCAYGSPEGSYGSAGDSVPYTHWVGCEGHIPSDYAPTGGWGQFPRLQDAINLCHGCKGCQNCEGAFGLGKYAAANINVDCGNKSVEADIKRVANKIAACLDCMIKNKIKDERLWIMHNPVEGDNPDVYADLVCLLRMFTTGQWFICEDVHKNRFPEQVIHGVKTACCWGSPSCDCCVNPLNGVRDRIAIACNYNTCSAGLGHGKYFLICSIFGKDWQTGNDCRKMMWLLHEALHHCHGVTHPQYSTPSLNKVAAFIVDCCDHAGCGSDPLIKGTLSLPGTGAGGGVGPGPSSKPGIGCC